MWKAAPAAKSCCSIHARGSPPHSDFCRDSLPAPFTGRLRSTPAQLKESCLPIWLMNRLIPKRQQQEPLGMICMHPSLANTTCLHANNYVSGGINRWIVSKTLFMHGTLPIVEIRALSGRGCQGAWRSSTPSWHGPARLSPAGSDLRL